MSFWKGFAGGLQAGATIRDRWDERGGFGITGLGSDSRGAAASTAAEKPAGADVATGGDGAAAPAPAGDLASNIPATLIRTESGGNWRAQNDAMGAGGQRGHYGRLQFGRARLSEAAAAGAIPQGTTPEQFMASPDLQRAAERWHFNDIDADIRRSGLDQYIGQTIGGVRVTADGMRAAAHLGGFTGLQRLLRSGGRQNAADRNGTTLLGYMRTHQSDRPFAVAGGGTAAQSSGAQASGGADSGSSPIRVRPGEARFEPIFAPAAQPAPARQARPDTLEGGDGLAPLIDGRNLPDASATARGGAIVPGARAAVRADGSGVPLIDGRNLPQSGHPPRPISSDIFPPAEGAGRATGGVSVAPGGRAAVQVAVPRRSEAVFPGEPEPAAPSAAAALSAAEAPSEAPVPSRRPAEAPGAPGSAPVPQPRPFGAPGLGVSERDRLMLLRDEGSLTPDEAERLRAGLPAGESPFGFFGLGRGRG